MMVRNKRFYLFLLFMLYSFFIGAFFAKAQSVTTGAIRGAITNGRGQPLANITVIAVKKPENAQLLYNLPFSFPPWVPEDLSEKMKSHTSLYGYYPYGYPYYISSPHYSLPEPYRSKSQADGTFLLDELPQGAYFLWAYDAEGGRFRPAFFPLSGTWSGPGIKNTEETISLLTNIDSVRIPIGVTAGKTAGPFNLIMEEGGNISGHIKELNSDMPIKGAVIEILRQYDEFYPSVGDIYLVSSDAQGEFHFSGLQAGEYYMRVVQADDYILSYDEHYDTTYTIIAGKTMSGLTIRLRKGGKIFGTITNKENGQPIAEVMLSVSVKEPEIYYPFSPLVSNEDGTYSINGLESGTYFLMIPDTFEFRGTYFPNTSDPKKAQEIHVEAGSIVGPINFQLNPKNFKGSIEGQIVDEGTGSPLSGIEVQLNILYPEGEDPYTAYYTDSEESYYVPPLTIFYYPSMVSDSLGNFKFTHLEEGNYSLYISDPTGKYHASSYPKSQYGCAYYGYKNNIELSHNQRLENIRISLARGGCIEGRVVNGAEPLAGIQVMGQREKDASYYLGYYPSWTSLSLTDTEGNFAICGIQEGSYSLLAYDLLQRGYKPTNYPNANLKRMLIVTSGSTISDITIPMEVGVAVSGKVVDEAGNPLSHIPLRLEPSTIESGEPYVGYYPTHNIYSREDGTYAFTGLIEGTYHLYAESWNSPYLPACVSNITVSSLKGSTVDVVLPMGGVLSGKVTSAGGHPLQGIYVTANLNMTTDYAFGEMMSSLCNVYYSQQFYAETQEDGTYRIEGIPGGDYYLLAEDYEGLYARSDYPQGLVTIVEGEETKHINFTMAKGGIIKGTIRDQATGDPIPDLLVKAQEYTQQELNESVFPEPDPSPYPYLSTESKSYISTRSDKEGRYTIQGLPKGTYTVVAVPASFYQMQYYKEATSIEESTLITIDFEETRENIDFSLVEGMSLEGTLRDALTGDPIPGGGSIRLMDEHNRQIQITYADSYGEYTVSGLLPGTYYIQVDYWDDDYYGMSSYSEGADPAEFTPVVISEREPTKKVDIFLSPKARIRGKIVDEYDLQPLEEQIIIAIPEEWNPTQLQEFLYYRPPYDKWIKCALTDEEGLYTIKGLTEGGYRIIALDPHSLYQGQYYKDFPHDQWEQATIITLTKSEIRDGINMEMQVGDTPLGDEGYPYNLVSYGGCYMCYDRVYTSYSGYGVEYAYSGLQPTSASFGGMTLSTQSLGYPTVQQAGQEMEIEPIKIISEPVTQVIAGRDYTYEVQVADTTNDMSLTFTLKRKPEGMDIDTASGHIQWHPMNEDTGSPIVQVEVSNERDQVAFQSFRVQVIEDLTPPEEVQALSAQRGDTKISLSWNASQDTDADLEKQLLYIDDGNGYGQGIVLDKTSTSYTATDLENGHTYTFKITTQDSLGNESTGVTVSGTPGIEVQADSWQLLQSWYFAFYSSNISRHITPSLTLSWHSSWPFMWWVAPEKMSPFLTPVTKE
ncbi:MAG: fibronectin type III domain-containing protein [bacterium]